MPIDLQRETDHYVLSMDLPGVDPGSIDISVEDRILTIRAERTTPSAGADWLVRERPSGTFARQLTLGQGLALDQISAAYTDGVLSLTIPVSEQAKPRRIEVAHVASPSQLGAGAPAASESASTG
ncbi:Hsp20/alpha crystallin family protein [Occultella gossypii]